MDEYGHIRAGRASVEFASPERALCWHVVPGRSGDVLLGGLAADTELRLAVASSTLTCRPVRKKARRLVVE